MFLIAFNIFGLLLNFVGTIFLSLGLLRSSEEIIDEESTYLGANPYTTRGAMRAQPYYNVGFRMLICGFAINLAVSAEAILPHNKELQTVIVAFSVALIGLLLSQFFQSRKRLLHILYKEDRTNAQYIAFVGSTLSDVGVKSTQAAFQAGQGFTSFREAKAESLVNKTPGLSAKRAKVVLKFSAELKAATDFASVTEMLTAHVQEFSQIED